MTPCLSVFNYLLSQYTLQIGAQNYQLNALQKVKVIAIFQITVATPSRFNRPFLGRVNPARPVQVANTQPVLTRTHNTKGLRGHNNPLRQFKHPEIAAPWVIGSALRLEWPHWPFFRNPPLSYKALFVIPFANLFYCSSSIQFLFSDVCLSAKFLRCVRTL